MATVEATSPDNRLGEPRSSLTSRVFNKLHGIINSSKDRRVKDKECHNLRNEQVRLTEKKNKKNWSYLSPFPSPPFHARSPCDRPLSPALREPPSTRPTSCISHPRPRGWLESIAVILVTFSPNLASRVYCCILFVFPGVFGSGCIVLHPSVNRVSQSYGPRTHTPPIIHQHWSRRRPLPPPAPDPTTRR